MTETEWQTCADSIRMLYSIRDKVNRRKERLFTSACCRRLWEWLSDKCRRQVEMIERYAEDSKEPDIDGETFQDAFEASQEVAPEGVRGAFTAVILEAGG